MKSLVLELIEKQLVKQVGVGGVPGVDSGATAYRRTHGAAEGSVTVVKGQMLLRQERDLQPTIAVITSQYHEKVAVDAVMTNKRTFVRYATVGESTWSDLGRGVWEGEERDASTLFSLLSLWMLSSTIFLSLGFCHFFCIFVLFALCITL